MCLKSSSEDFCLQNKGINRFYERQTKMWIHYEPNGVFTFSTGYSLRMNLDPCSIVKEREEMEAMIGEEGGNEEMDGMLDMLDEMVMEELYR